MCDFVLVTETRHLFAGEVCSVVRNNGVGELKAAYYVLPICCPVSSKSGTVPFDEVVSG